MKKTDIIFLAGSLLSALLVAVMGCTKPVAPSHTNPADSLNPDFIKPSAVIVYPLEGDTLTGTQDTIRWTRVGSAAEFSWQMDNEGWHTWESDTFAIYSNITEGFHTFQVQARDGGEGSYFDSTLVAVRHYIKNRYSNAIMLYPLSQSANYGDTVEFWCELEDMSTPVAGIKLRFRTSYVYYLDTISTGADTGIMWVKNGGSPVGPFFNTSSGPDYYYFDLSVGVAGGTPAGVTGSGRILKFKVEALYSGSIYIYSVDARDTLNNAIAGVTYQNTCYVTVAKQKEGGK
jgi:hypothetical protein